MNDIETVRGLIIAAFQYVPIPAKDDIVMMPTTGDLAGEEAIRESLAGKHWGSLTAEFLERRMFSFCYLSAEAFRHYLPALMTTSLDRFEDGRNLAHSTIFIMKPSEHAVYYHGRDERIERQVALFTPEQFAAVAAYLGLFLTEAPDNMAFLAARAFRWGWDRIATPERALVRDFYHAMHHWTPAIPDDPQAASLVEEIRQAFENAPYPGDDKLCGSKQGDEPAESALDFRGLDWRQAHPRILAENYSALSFLTPEAFRYYLPAYLIADLSAPEVESNADPLFHLTHGFTRSTQPSLVDDLSDDDLLTEVVAQFGEPDEIREIVHTAEQQSREVDWFAYGVERMRNFTRPERQAVIHYLEWWAERDDYQSPSIHEALEQYWRPSIEG